MYKSLKELAVITMGQSPKSSCYNTNGTGIPFLQGRTTFGRVYPSYDTWSSQWNKEALPNDILFTVRAPVGDVNISKDKIAIGRGIASIRAVNCNPRYLFYLLQASNSIFTSNSTGTIFESINKDTLENTVLNVHSNENQVHIVDTIGSIDELIEKYEWLIQKLDSYIDLIYKKISLSKNYSFKKLNEICDIKYGKAIEANKLTNTRKYSVYGGNGIIGTLDTYEHNDYKISISCRGAASGNILITEPYSTISSNSLYLDLYDELNLFLVYMYLKKSNLPSMATGSAQPQITISNIVNYEIKVFDNNFNALFRNFLIGKSSIKNKIKKLNFLKQQYLKKFFG